MKQIGKKEREKKEMGGDNAEKIVVTFPSF